MPVEAHRSSDPSTYEIEAREKRTMFAQRLLLESAAHSTNVLPTIAPAAKYTPLLEPGRMS
jgi:hypothetical protein